jgi:hypothetical protein
MDNQQLTGSDGGIEGGTLWKSSPFQAYPTHEKTPFFVEGVTEKWIEKPGRETSMVAVDKETGEILQLYVPPKKIKVAHDPMTYGKVLRNGKVDGLSSSAKVVLMYVAFFIKMNRCDMELYYSRSAKWCRISKTSFYNAIRELLDAEIIAIKERAQHIFWINPNYIFNGNRTKMK